MNEREEFGFRRTVCGCAFCVAPCRHIPGGLAPSDLERMCPPGAELLEWAERHLRSVTETPWPMLVPVRGLDGACHWHFDGKCAVHNASPYGCAFFDSHMSSEEAQRRSAAVVQARREDAEQNGPYARVWRHLCQKGLTQPRGDREGLALDVSRIARNARRSRRRLESG